MHSWNLSAAARMHSPHALSGLAFAVWELGTVGHTRASAMSNIEAKTIRVLFMMLFLSGESLQLSSSAGFVTES